jgi:zinc/manganese transport system substrate-binding protein
MNMKKLLTIALMVVVPLAAHAKLNIVTTTPDLAAIAREIGGDGVEVQSLARPTEDAHFVQPRPSYIVALNRADALIEGGAGLEDAWLGPLVDSARNAKLLPNAVGRIKSAQNVALLEVPTVLDRALGDVHALGNPHFLTDPLNAKIAAQQICKAFCRLEPSSCEQFRENLESFSMRLDAKLVEWRKLLAPFAGSRIAAYHNTWPYFARRFGLRVDLFLEPKPGIPPSPAHLARVIAEMKEQNVRVILVEPHQNRRTAERVARETGATVLDVAQYPGGVKGTEDGYIELMDYLARSLANALGKNATP